MLTTITDWGLKKKKKHTHTQMSKLAYVPGYETKITFFTQFIQIVYQ